MRAAIGRDYGGGACGFKAFDAVIVCGTGGIAFGDGIRRRDPCRDVAENPHLHPVLVSQAGWEESSGNLDDARDGRRKYFVGFVVFVYV